MSEFNIVKIVQGDTPTIEIPLVDSNGDPLTNLSTVSEIIFMAKQNQDDLDGAALITLKLSLGDITKDDATGIIQLIFTESDTELVTPAQYLPFLKLLYNASSKQFHVNMTTEFDQPWEFLQVVESGIDESVL